MCAARSATDWRTVSRLLDEVETKRRTSLIAVFSSSASSSSRLSRATTVSWPATETPRLRIAFGALRCFSLVVLRRCNLADLPPALERRLIAFPKAQDKASCPFKLAHWKRPGAVLCATANFDRECPLWVISGHRGLSASCPLYPHVWTAPSWQGLFSRLQHWSVRPCVRPFSAAHRPLAIMPSADQVPINSAHSTNAWGEVGCPDRRIDRLCITCCLPFPTFTSRRMSARSRLRRQCDRFLVTLALRHHRPRHPRDLIGKSDGGDFGRSARQ